MTKPVLAHSCTTVTMGSLVVGSWCLPEPRSRPRKKPQVGLAKSASDPGPTAPPATPASRLDLSRLRVACGHRLIFGCPHTTGSSTVAGPPRPSLKQQGHGLRLED